MVPHDLAGFHHIQLYLCPLLAGNINFRFGNHRPFSYKSMQTTNILLPLLSILVSLPVLECLRHQFALSYGRPMVNRDDPASTKSRNVIGFALVSVVILVMITDMVRINVKII